MVKTYLKYNLKNVIGQITGKSCRPVVHGNLLYSACNEYVIVIDIKTGEIINKLTSDKSEVTCLANSGEYLAVGYHNGVIVLYDTEYSAVKRFSLHKSAITTMQFNNTILASGSKDTNIFIWDIIAESCLYRLSGHKDNIIKVCFHRIRTGYDEIDVLITCSKDNTLKIWNIKNQEVLQTIADLVHKVTDFLIVENILIVGSYDNKLRLYIFQKNYENNVNTYVSQKGVLSRQSNSKILSMSIINNKLISILSNDNSIEFFKVLTDNEMKLKLIFAEQVKNKKNAKREKLVLEDKYDEIAEKVITLIDNGEYNYKNRFHSLFNFYCQNDKKILGLFFINNKNNIWKFGLALGNNCIEIYDMNTQLLVKKIYKKKNSLVEEIKLNEDLLSVDKAYSIDKFGHRDVLRLIKYNDAGTIFFTASNDSIKLWNAASLTPIKTLEIENAVSGSFISSDRYIVFGTKNGSLYLVHTNSFNIVQKSDRAHEGEIWNIFLIKYSYIDSSYKILTCSTDKTIQYWNFTKNELSHYRTVTTLDQITYAMVSGKYLIYSMLDNSIRVIYEDTNKLFLNLYGHKLPVLSFDVSSDGTLLISGSADKNVKLWGLDFGDCHKSFFAHTDSVTCVKFVRDTHYFFSCSKDKAIRYWDADSVNIF
jgi:U3 small nucleolar RNA-associated protein 12